MEHNDTGTSKDRLTQNLLEDKNLYRTDFGLILPDAAGGNTGRYFLIAETSEQGVFLGAGEYEIRNGLGVCSDFDYLGQLTSPEIENVFNNPDFPYVDNTFWVHPAAELAGPMPQVCLEEMTREMRDSFPDDLEYVETGDFSTEFYRRQAELGFIAVARRMGDRVTLLPELQKSYAVLDWPDLVIERGVRKILESSRIDDENIRLAVSPFPEDVFEELERVWGGSTWLLPEYRQLLQNLAAEEEKGKNPGFRVWATVLYAGDHPAAGELGYSVGRTYTSLSGFLHRNRREWNNFGKLQMVLLGRHLEERGVDFWNLGHPYMDYKIRLGARIIPRGEFIRKWDLSSKDTGPDLSTGP